MEPEKVGRILFVGTGGGNDVFSAVLAALTFRAYGWTWDECACAGVLSPFHEHTVTETPLDGVFRIGPDSKRFVRRKDGRREIRFVDAAVAGMCQTLETLGRPNVFGLSLSRGSVGLAEAFRALAKTYDAIILVDVGGDCFYGGAQDPHVLSPMFDAMVICGFVEAEVFGFLFEAGPGTDGELEPESLEAAFAAAEATSHDLPPGIVAQWAELYKKWIEPVRRGNTVPTTLEAFSSQAEIITRPYRARAHIGDERQNVPFLQRIKPALCRKFFLVDPRRIDNPFAVPCVSPYDWFVKTQVMQHRTNCEANLEYLARPYQPNIIQQFLTPSPLFPPEFRLHWLEIGLSDLKQFICTSVWMFPEDWATVAPRWKNTFFVTEQNGLMEIFH